MLTVTLTSCGARKTAGSSSPQVIEISKHTSAGVPDKLEIIEEPEDDVVEFKVIENALEFLGTKYKYGGSNSNGMDCSGLIYTAFLKEDIALPRSSKDMALLGERLNLAEVKTGDLLFFETNKKRKIINHVGLVVEIDADKIYFIHSSTSRGVIISALDENYWREHFAMARRIQ